MEFKEKIATYDSDDAGIPGSPARQRPNQSPPSPSPCSRHEVQTNNRPRQFSVSRAEYRTPGCSNTCRGNRQIPNIVKFDGNPKDYHNFIKQWDYAVGDSDNYTQLLCLVNNCVGRAGRAVAHCTSMDVDSGLKFARKTLKRYFGTRDMVADAFLDPIREGPRIAENSAMELQELGLEMRACMETLSSLGYQSELRNSKDLVTIVNRLPFRLRLEWAKLVVPITEREEEPTFSDLQQFIEESAIVLTTRYGKSIFGNRKFNHTTNKTHKADIFLTKFDSNTDSKPSSLRCMMCEQPHLLEDCPQFEDLTVDERREFALRRGLCFACLDRRHLARDCDKNIRCGLDGCSRRHNRLLHGEPKRSHEATTSYQAAVSVSDDAEYQKETQDIALAVVPVRISNGSHSVRTLAFLDTGSNKTLIKEDLVRKLKLEGATRQMQMKTMAGSSVVIGREVAFDVASDDTQQKIHVDSALSIKRLPNPKRIIINDELRERYAHLRDIPSGNYEDLSVGVLLGCDVPEAHWILAQRIGGRQDPCARRTPLGWVILGPLHKGNGEGIDSNFANLEELEDSLRQFYRQDAIDTVGVQEKAMSVEDKNALEILESSISCEGNKYQMGLPWRVDPTSLQYNRNHCMHRLESLKKRLKRTPELRDRYNQELNKYLQKGYAEEIRSNPDAIVRWYLPHHPVFHPAKPDKVRIVFDCAARHGGVSLNDCLYSGPDVNNSLIGVLLRFRQEPIAFMADIEAMFHQVRVSEKDRDALRFLWWPGGNLEETPRDYRMKVHLFGAKSSPCCAMLALQRTIADNSHKYDGDLVNVAKRSFYVDDLLVSVRKVETAKRYVKQLKELLSLGGFNLTKWQCNMNGLIDRFEFDGELKNMELNPSISNIHGALGLKWDVQRDEFVFRMKELTGPNTRRNILSFVASIYDPMGLISPITLTARLVLQRLCKMKYDWDTEIEGDEKELWTKWAFQLRNVENLSIPRLVRKLDNISRYELHVFCDASECAYGAVAYIVSYNQKNVPHYGLLYSKAKVAPIQPITIPRLELMSATVAARMVRVLKQELDINFEKILLWTDSTIVLHSIQNTSTRFPTFVANRLSIIHENTDPLHWRHIDTKSNPADIASRGVTANQVAALLNWFEGPLLVPDHIKQDVSTVDTVTDASVYWTETQNYQAGSFIERFKDVKSWYKLQRLISWLRRYVAYIQRKQVKSGHLTISELKEAKHKIVSLVQQEAFPREMTAPSRTKQTPQQSDEQIISSSSLLRKLKPFLSKGLLRVGGRLQNAKLPYDMMHPVILPGRHFVVRLLAEHFHTQNCHAGLTQTVTMMKREYWIIGLCRSVKSVIDKCGPCRRWLSKPCSQQMAPLPRDRVEENTDPFTICGVDYFGPIPIKRGRTTERRYGCLFTCFSSRAVHIEISHSLDTDSFLCAFNRFIARRGCPQRLYSDNACNFVRAERDIKKVMESWNQEKIAKKLLLRNCDWIYIPPKASHRGGVWERIIRSVKRALLVTLEGKLVTEEILQTTLIEIERTLNDRPLVKQISDPDDFYTLTPSKLLLLRSGGAQSLPDAVDTNHFNRRWRLAHQMADEFWRKWIKSYLPQLQVTQKWFGPRPNVHVGELVLLVDRNLPRGNWTKGIIVGMEKDKDDLIREVIIRTVKGVIRRDIRHICRLEGDSGNTLHSTTQNSSEQANDH